MKLVATTMILSMIFPPIYSNAIENDKQTSFVEKQKSNNTDLSELQKKQLEERINELLSLKYKIMQSGTFESCNTFVSNEDLIEVLDKSNKLYDKWCKSNGLICDSYTSNVNISNIELKNNDTYTVNVLYSVQFQMKDSDTVSKVSNDEYKLDINKVEGEFYVSKMQDAFELQEDNANQNMRLLRRSKISKADNYENSLNEKKERLNEVDNNFEQIKNNLNELKNNIETSEDNIKSNTFTKSRSSYHYNHDTAVNYAHRYALSPNTDYRYYNGNDCTNFVSQCVFFAGVPYHISWFPQARAWTVVQDFYDDMTSNGYAIDDGGGCKHALLGDIVQYYGGGQWHHSVILTKKDNKGVYYCAHSNNRYDAPVWEPIFSGDFSNIRALLYWA